MRTFSRFLRLALLPVALLAMVAGSTASASAATDQTGNNVGNNVQVTVTAPLIGRVHPNSSSW